MAYVSIHYGPYEAWGIVRHRTQHLRGLKEQLALAGHTVELIPSLHWDRCVIEIARRNIFRCRLTNFEYYTDGKEDVVVRRAMEAVRDAVVRMKPSFLYPDIPLFSLEFFEDALHESFRQLNVREYIDECLESAFTYMTVLECIDVAIDESFNPVYMRSLLGEAVESALQKDYMKDLIELNLERAYELRDFMEDIIIGAVNIRDFMKYTIMEAINRTHPMIKEFIKNSIDSAFKNACSILNLKGGSFGDLIKSTKITPAEETGIKQILNDIVDELSLRSMASSRSIQKTESQDTREPSYDSLDYEQSRTSYDDRSNQSFDLSRSRSSQSNSQ